MALIKCKNCGHVISDKALCCPNCGYKQEDTPNSEKEIDISTVEDKEEQFEISEDNEQQVNRDLVIVVIILSIIAIALGSYLIGAGKSLSANLVPSDSTAIDSIPVDTVKSDTAATVSTTETICTTDSATSSNDYNSNEQIEEEEIGFKSNMDVMDFVVGNSYSHNGITLRITDEAVYANDNKISTSKPVFRKVSPNKGMITARPSISITVVRDDNRLVDNNNGDTYYY